MKSILLLLTLTLLASTGYSQLYQIDSYLRSEKEKRDPTLKFPRVSVTNTQPSIGDLAKVIDSTKSEEFRKKGIAEIRLKDQCFDSLMKSSIAVIQDPEVKELTSKLLKQKYRENLLNVKAGGKGQPVEDMVFTINRFQISGNPLRILTISLDTVPTSSPTAFLSTIGLKCEAPVKEFVRVLDNAIQTTEKNITHLGKVLEKMKEGREISDEAVGQSSTPQRAL